MEALARWSFRHRRVVLLSWVVLLVGVIALASAVGSDFRNSFSLPGTDSQRAVDLLRRDFPARSGESDTIVWATGNGSVRDAAVRARVTPMLARVARLPHVRDVVSPYGPQGAGQVSRDGRVAFATVVFDTRGDLVPTAAIERVISTAQAARAPGLRVELGGEAIGRTEQANLAITELVGVLGAAIILFIAFGSFLAMLLPLASAIAALGVGLSLIDLLSRAVTVADFSSSLAVLIGLGVGVDYALFIVSRHRGALKQGKTPEQAVVLALTTSGRAVIFAGATVCIALLGLFALGVGFLYGVALSAALAVALTVISSITLLPALLGFLGPRVLSRRDRRRLAESGPEADEPSGRWARWAAFVERRPVALAAGAALFMVVLAIPFFSLRLGASDQGNNPKSHTTRQAYDLLAQGFGPGFNGPLELAAQLDRPGDRAALDRVGAAVGRDPGVAAVGPVRLSPTGTAAVVQVYPTTSPQAAATDDLLTRLRDHVIPGAAAGSGLVVHLGGVTATSADFASVLSGKLPLFIAIVVGLSFLLLVVAFRSLAIPAMAAVMNLLSAGAAFGVMVAVFQWGWAASLIGVDKKGPIEAFIPVFVFAILFGLSMDYQVFLVSRMRETWVKTGNNAYAVNHGQAATGRVITAAAAIMVLVFGSFALGGDRVLKLFGLGLAIAVLLDALVIRTILVPALMHLIGRGNWWLPNWLGRVVPRFSVEGDAGAEAAVEPEGRPDSVVV